MVSQFLSNNILLHLFSNIEQTAKCHRNALKIHSEIVLNNSESNFQFAKLPIELSLELVGLKCIENVS